MSFVPGNRKGTYKIFGRVSHKPTVIPANACYKIVVDYVEANYSLSSDASNFWVCWVVRVGGLKFEVKTDKCVGEVWEDIEWETHPWFKHFVEENTPVTEIHSSKVHSTISH